jgi:hypothetical protein
MKYKVGDKVIIKPKEEFVHSKYRNPHGFMDIYCGRAAVIVSQGFDYYRIDIDGGFWNWYDDMLEDNNVGMYGELRGFPQAYFSGTFSMTESNKKTHSIDLIGEHKFLTLKVES